MVFMHGYGFRDHKNVDSVYVLGTRGLGPRFLSLPSSNHAQREI